MYEDTAEDHVWRSTPPHHLWVMDKLILSRHLGYVCGPTGLDVPQPGWYIVRPCVNMLGLGLGAQKLWIAKDTTHLPLGYFWCEWFEGRHLSIDYNYGIQRLAVEGFRHEVTNFTKWKEWKKVDDKIDLPEFLNDWDYPWINCEFIGGKLIEVHLRRNEDFDGGISHFIPVWDRETIDPPEGYKYIEYPDIHGRKGAYVK